MNNFWSLKVRKRFWMPILSLFLILYIWAALSPKVEVHYVYKICPVFVCYDDTAANLLMKDWMGAVTRGFIVISREENFASKWAETHELTHAKQAYRTFMLMPIAAMVSDRVLLEMEAEAYAVMANNEQDLEIAAELLDKYYFDGKVDKRLISNRLEYFWLRRKNVSADSGGA